ncbi:DUF4365 domain-containing protein [Nocardiopsis coralliicola]
MAAEHEDPLSRGSDARDLVDGQLPMNARQEQFSVAFTRMIAYEAGCGVKYHETDYEGVDITITSAANYRFYQGAQLELQLKCTTQQHKLGSEYLTWQMQAKPYKKLTAPNRYLPAYLGVLILPDSDAGWLSVNHDRLVTESRMYWQAAAELPPLAGPEGSKTVHIPRRNLFTGEKLLDIMRSIGDAPGGGSW